MLNVMNNILFDLHPVSIDYLGGADSHNADYGMI